MARRQRHQLVLLPRDPEMAYVYWEWPQPPGSDQPATLLIYVDGSDQRRYTVGSFEVTDRRGGRFVPFGRPGAIHRCELTWGDHSEQSKPVRAPRRESGTDAPRFVRVELTEQGLRTEAADHDHPVHGHLPGGDIDISSSDHAYE